MHERTDAAMDIREFLGYTLGTAFVLALMAGAAAAIVVLVGALPMVLIVFPVTAGLVAIVLAVGYLRHRRRRRRRRGPPYRPPSPPHGQG